jgi:septal ring factor EnvC (AmiA/AmiB activator)
LEEGEEAKKNGKEKELEEKKKEEEKLNKEKQERDKLRRWLETELSNIEEAIRVRKEVAIVRGAVEANRIVEGENLYGDDMELSVEKVIGLPVLASTTSISTSM